MQLRNTVHEEATTAYSAN